MKKYVHFLYGSVVFSPNLAKFNQNFQKIIQNVERNFTWIFDLFYFRTHGNKSQFFRNWFDILFNFSRIVIKIFAMLHTSIIIDKCHTNPIDYWHAILQIYQKKNINDAQQSNKQNDNSNKHKRNSKQYILVSKLWLLGPVQ